MIVIIGILSLCYYIFKDNIKTKSDLVAVNSTLFDYTFTEDRGFKHHTYSYYIHLNGFSNNFQITADMVCYFEKAAFENNIKAGDSLKIFVSKYDFFNIHNEERVPAFGIYSKNSSYMNCERAIKVYNSRLNLYGGSIFILAGIIMFYFYRKKKKTTINEDYIA